MNVLALVPNVRGFSPGQRSSIELWERVLRASGIHIQYAPFETDRLHEVLYEPGHTGIKVIEMLRAYKARVSLMSDLSRFDAVFVYREAALLGPALIERLVARRGKPIIYQLDDPLYIPYRSPSNGYLSYLKFFGKVSEICRISQVVIVNSTHHREFALQYNSNVWQIPSVVDTEQYTFCPDPAPSSDVCIGWSGSPSTVGNLRIVAEVLRELSKRVKYRTHLIGGERKDFDLPDVDFTAQRWQSATEVEDLRKIHIGMVPLPVNEWNKRKFYLKVVQYMALGIPPVCTPLGSNPEVIQHGVTGFLADTSEEWLCYLERLIKEPAMRLEMSNNAARVAQERYSLKANAEIIVGAFRAALN